MCGRGRPGVPDSGWGPVGGVTVGKPAWTGGDDITTGDLRGESQGVWAPRVGRRGWERIPGWEASLAFRLKALNGGTSTRCPGEQPEPLRSLGSQAAGRASPECEPRPGFPQHGRRGGPALTPPCPLTSLNATCGAAAAIPAPASAVPGTAHLAL